MPTSSYSSDATFPRPVCLAALTERLYYEPELLLVPLAPAVSLLVISAGSLRISASNATLIGKGLLTQLLNNNHFSIWGSGDNLAFSHSYGIVKDTQVIDAMR